VNKPKAPRRLWKPGDLLVHKQLETVVEVRGKLDCNHFPVVVLCGTYQCKTVGRKSKLVTIAPGDEIGLVLRHENWRRLDPVDDALLYADAVLARRE